jgi:hypothetical protein
MFRLIFHYLSGEYFPIAYNDTIYVWEDESIAFDALANDYFAGDNATIVEYTKVRVEAVFTTFFFSPHFSIL